MAYAVRAAMRVRSRYGIAKADDLSRAAEKAVDAAIDVARSFAADDGFEMAAAKAAEEGVIKAVMLAGDPERGNKPSALAANAAYAAVDAALAAAETVESKSPQQTGTRVVNAARTAAEAAVAANSHARHGLARDYQTLATRARCPFPELGRAVDLGPGGPLSKGAGKAPGGEAAAAPSEADLLEILRLRDAIQADRAELENQRREIDKKSAGFEAERNEIEQAREEIERERHVLESRLAGVDTERERVRQFVAELHVLLTHHGFDFSDREIRPAVRRRDEPAVEETDDGQQPSDQESDLEQTTDAGEDFEAAEEPTVDDATAAATAVLTRLEGLSDELASS